MRGLTGEVLDGRYALGPVLGDGGAGVVYRARDGVEGGDVAVKILHAALTATEEVRARFEREARALATLTSPHTVRLLAFGTARIGTLRDVGYLVMELASGVTLAERLDAGPLDPL